MPRARFVVPALLGAALLVIVASVLALRPAGEETASVGDDEDDREAVMVLHSADFIETRGATLGDPEDFRAGPAAPRAKTESSGHTTRPASSRPVREPGDDGEYVDPLADHPVSPLGGVTLDVGEFLHPERDDPTLTFSDRVSDIGDYLVPEEGP